MSDAGQEEENVATDFFVEMDKAVGSATNAKEAAKENADGHANFRVAKEEDTFLTQSGGPQAFASSRMRRSESANELRIELDAKNARREYQAKAYSDVLAKISTCA